MKNVFLSLAMMSLLLCAACGSDECTPACDGLKCGDDGCGGTCGTCEGTDICFEGLCIGCQPVCENRDCGPDGCGGECGKCVQGLVCRPSDWTCNSVPQGCIPDCAAVSACGPDGCGELCGECVLPQVCDALSSVCKDMCVPDCADSECGPDGCGGSCGTCSVGAACENGHCAAGRVLPDEDFLIMYNERGRIAGYNNEESELFLMKPDATDPVYGTAEPYSLTSFADQAIPDCQLILSEDAEGNPLETAPCSCKLGCVIDDKVSWIAMSIKKPDMTGFTFRLGRFNAMMEVKMVKGVVMEGVIDFKFAGNWLYYTKINNCAGLNCQYDIYRMQLDPVQMPEKLFMFPPVDDPDWPTHSTYKGHIKASRDGSVLVLLGTTVRSMRLYSWKAGQLTEMDYICMTRVGEECVGAGSEYNDQDPVAISDDGQTIAMFSIAEKDLRLRLYDTDSRKIKSLTLFSVPDGSYMPNICEEIQGTPWKWRYVKGDPIVSPDGKSIFFMAYDDCGIADNQKAETDIMMMDLASVGDGTYFEESDLVNLTKNPKNQSVDNLLIHAFALSPEARVLVIAGTPKFAGGKPLTSEDKRALKDKEVWVMGINGAGKAQLTDSVEYETISVRTVKGDAVPFLGRTR